MAFPVTLNGRTYTLADFSGTNYVDGFPDALEDFVTQAGNIYTTTSTSSVVIGTGSKTFTVADSAKPYIVGTPLRIADAAAPATNWIDGIVTSYSGTTLVVNAVAYAGSGTISSWNINIGGSAVAYTGTLPVAQGGTGATTEAAARTNLDVYSKSEADAKFLDVSGEASNVTMTGNVTIGDAAGDTLTVNATATLADATITTADINGGTIDGTVIGGSTPAAVTGTTITATGGLTVDNDGATVLTVDRATSDGAIVDFQKDGSSVGSISSIAGFTVIGSGDTGILFDATADAVKPRNSSTASRDAAIDLGGSGDRFKDLYLSGGVYLGGTGAANLLDDYEEGEYEVSITPSVSGTVTIDTSYNTATYERVGDVVHVHGSVDTASVSSPVGYFGISLPFTNSNLGESKSRSVGSISMYINASANVRDFVTLLVEGESALRVYLGDATTLQSDSAQQITSGSVIAFSVTYRAA